VKQTAYPYNLTARTNRYTFTSFGKRSIVKQVIFTYTGIDNIINMGFGDLQSDGSIDDKANSNNGDMVKVLATVVQVLREFVSKFPKAKIFFSGSTLERTKLYTRIIRTYYEDFSKDFIITGVVKEGQAYIEFPFHSKADLAFEGFYIEKN
jgi:hypothetical protein